MLIFRKYKDNDRRGLEQLLADEGMADFNFDGLIYLAIEDGALVGLAKGDKFKNRWFLEYLLIAKDKRGRGLGDALLRSILNRMNNLGARWVYSTRSEDYLLYKGFTLNEFGELELDVDEFFDKPCDGSGSCHV
ncbi:MAG: GNAT family N-acetyltransferase [Tissierellaceae bacterium]